MNAMSRCTAVLLLAGPVTLAACAPAPPGDAPATEAGEAAAPPPTDQLPQGHPPIGAEAMTIPTPEPGSGTGVGALTWDVPGTWVAGTPTSPMRRAQYRVPGEGGDGECVVFYFGPGQGGDSLSNAQRWAMQFAQADGSSPLDAMQTERIDVGGVSVMLVEITGTYQVGRQMGGTGQPLAGQMLLGAIAEGPDANWFFKLTGPEPTVRGQRQAFREMIDSIRAGS